MTQQDMYTHVLSVFVDNKVGLQISEGFGLSSINFLKVLFFKFQGGGGVWLYGEALPEVPFYDLGIRKGMEK